MRLIRKNEISWEQTTVLKDKINAVFEALKAVKRINNENEDQANAVLVKNYYKRIEDLQAKLIYNDQWKFIFEELKNSDRIKGCCHSLESQTYHL